MPLTKQELENLRLRYNRIVVGIVQGELMEITYVTSASQTRSPGKRRSVGMFTPASRLRMLRSVARIRWDAVGPSLFITLTYPDEVASTTKEERTIHRSRLLRDLEKHLGKEFGALWRVEWQARKSGMLKGTMVPHVHLCVFDVGWIPYQVINASWRVVLSVSGPLRTDVRRIRGTKEVAKYVSKYCAKVDPNHSLVNASYLNITGRHWGIHRRNLIPWGERQIELHLTSEEIHLYENAALMKIPYFPAGTNSGFTLFGPIVAEVRQEIQERWLDKVNTPK